MKKNANFIVVTLIGVVLFALLLIVKCSQSDEKQQIAASETPEQVIQKPKIKKMIKATRKITWGYLKYPKRLLPMKVSSWSMGLTVLNSVLTFFLVVLIGLSLKDKEDCHYASFWMKKEILQIGIIRRKY